MQDPPRLRDLQLRLRDAILQHGDGSAGSLAALEEIAARLPILGAPNLSAGRRLAIYATMHSARILEVLAEDFPATARAAGEHFDRLVTTYLAAHPPDDPSLRRVGRHLPGFLESHPRIALTPWLAELAGLEWATIEAFDARDERVLASSDLSSIPAEQWPALRLAPVHSLRVVTCRYPTDEIRREILAGATPASGPQAICLRVWRQGETVFHRRMSDLEAKALAQLLSGASFGDFCAAVTGWTRPEDAATRAVGLLQLWLEDELLVAPET